MPLGILFQSKHALGGEINLRAMKQSKYILYITILKTIPLKISCDYTHLTLSPISTLEMTLLNTTIFRVYANKTIILFNTATERIYST